tara:strand:- start:720 stop:965 length:246 start_codon:yes stop_codon:yes gene_type:complete
MKSKGNIMKKLSPKFLVTWLSGYGDNDGKQEIHTLEEISTWGLDAYMGDYWRNDFAMLQVGEELLVGGPCGTSEVKYERMC